MWHLELIARERLGHELFDLTATAALPRINRYSSISAKRWNDASSTADKANRNECVAVASALQ
jgi:hypothetical protein